MLAGFPHASKTRAGEPPPSLFYPFIQRSNVAGCSVGSSAGFQQLMLCGLALGRAAYTQGLGSSVRFSTAALPFRRFYPEEVWARSRQY